MAKEIKEYRPSSSEMNAEWFAKLKRNTQKDESGRTQADIDADEILAEIDARERGESIDEFRAKDASRKRQSRKAHREQVLPPSRICSCCGRRVLQSRRWVLLTFAQCKKLKDAGDPGHVAVCTAGCICKSCYMSYYRQFFGLSAPGPIQGTEYDFSKTVKRPDSEE